MKENKKKLRMMIRQFLKEEMIEIKRKCTSTIEEEGKMASHLAIFKFRFELKAIRTSSEKNITFNSTSEIFSDALDQKMLQFHHYHFKNFHHEGFVKLIKDPKGVKK